MTLRMLFILESFERILWHWPTWRIMNRKFRKIWTRRRIWWIRPLNEHVHGASVFMLQDFPLENARLSSMWIREIGWGGKFKIVQGLGGGGGDGGGGVSRERASEQASERDDRATTTSPFARRRRGWFNVDRFALTFGRLRTIYIADTAEDATLFHLGTLVRYNIGLLAPLYNAQILPNVSSRLRRATTLVRPSSAVI